ncbi:CcdB family protein [Pseudohongiella sp. SYSU M77423]|uniref:CcdB family protein n=1 Tax=unclassified Pseudohongiella TaxID=2629611 RepID=UPI001F430FEE|nr:MULTISPECIES: CcdB family protein [unclassified Pseudohongiella]MDH7944988.1 CcdB family protein [Pseudohongiella sp. SYSU M77423]
MAQFVAYQNPNPNSCEQFPYLLDIQSNLLDDLRTTIVVPLSPSESVANITISKLNPVLDINGNRFTAMVQDMAGIDRKQLGREFCDLALYRSEIIAAVDFVLSGI